MVCATQLLSGLALVLNSGWLCVELWLLFRVVSGGDLGAGLGFLLLVSV